MLERQSDDSSTDCCGAPGPDPRIARHFDQRMRTAAEAGQFPEMVEISRGLLDMLGDDAARLQPTYLELGCGSGALMVSLLERGAANADGVDLSSESIATALRRAEASGVGDRVKLQVGDGAVVQVEPHDWVLVDRVICCYPHMDRLLGNAVGAATRRFAFSVPRDSGWQGLVNRLIVGAENATNRLRGRPCPGYVHSIRKVERRLREAGFERLRDRKVGLWYAAVWERPGSAAPGTH